MDCQVIVHVADGLGDWAKTTFRRCLVPQTTEENVQNAPVSQINASLSKTYIQDIMSNLPGVQLGSTYG